MAPLRRFGFGIAVGTACAILGAAAMFWFRGPAAVPGEDNSASPKLTHTAAEEPVETDPSAPPSAVVEAGTQAKPPLDYAKIPVDTFARDLSDAERLLGEFECRWRPLESVGETGISTWQQDVDAARAATQQFEVRQRPSLQSKIPANVPQLNSPDTGDTP